MLKKQSLPFFYNQSKAPQIWGLKSPVTKEEQNQYREDLVNFLNDLEEIGFNFYLVNSYGNQVLVVVKT